jgi:hypothetical protein
MQLVQDGEIIVAVEAVRPGQGRLGGLAQVGRQAGQEVPVAVAAVHQEALVAHAGGEGGPDAGAV